MEIQEISTKLVELLREGKFEDVYDQLFELEKVKHIEPQSPHFPEIIGVSAIKEKDKAMGGAIEQVNSLEVGNPIIAKKSLCNLLSN